MSGEIGGKHVQNEVQCSVRIEVELPNKTDDFAPNMTGASVNFLETLRWHSGCRRMRGTHATGQLYNQFAIAFGLLSQKVELVLLVTV